MEQQQTNSYKKLQVETADPIDLVIMLYDRAIVLLEKAIGEIAEKDYEGKNHSLIKANDIVFELLSTLDREKGGDIATSLERLYGFVIREITNANTNLDTKAVDNAKKILSELREAWVSIKNNPDTVLNNTDNNISNIDLSG